MRVRAGPDEGYGKAMRSALFWTLAGVDMAAAAIVAYFFVEGLGDGTISSSNALLWLGLVTAPAAILAVAFRLRSLGRLGLATGALAIMAVPALAFGLLTAVLLGPGSYR